MERFETVNLEYSKILFYLFLKRRLIILDFITYLLLFFVFDSFLEIVIYSIIFLILLKIRNLFFVKYKYKKLLQENLNETNYTLYFFDNYFNKKKGKLNQSILYQDILKIVETEKYLFIIINKNDIIPIKKCENNKELLDSIKEATLKIKKINEFYISKLSFSMIAITFFIFLSWIWITKELAWKERYSIVLIESLPFFIYLLLGIFSNLFVHRKFIRKIIPILEYLFIIFSMFYYAITIFICAIIIASNPIKNIQYYSDYIKSEYLLKVFPKAVPKDVDNVQFLHSLPLFQKSAVDSLYYVDRNLEIENFDNKYSEKSKWIGYYKDSSYSRNIDMLLGRMFYDTPIVEEDKNHFRIYLIDGACDDSEYCNHGNYLLVAVNLITKDVLYKSENW